MNVLLLPAEQCCYDAAIAASCLHTPITPACLGNLDPLVSVCAMRVMHAMTNLKAVRPSAGMHAGTPSATHAWSLQQQWQHHDQAPLASML